MCGICGIFNLNGETVPHGYTKSMTDVMAHRGPDDEGHYIDVNIALGHRRLAIIDLTPAGHQPMSNQTARSYWFIAAKFTTIGSLNLNSRHWDIDFDPVLTPRFCSMGMKHGE
jgi:glutamate synthase domain-containing protein 1